MNNTINNYIININQHSNKEYYVNYSFKYKNYKLPKNYTTRIYHLRQIKIK